MWPADKSQLTWPQYSSSGPIRGESCDQLTNAITAQYLHVELDDGERGVVCGDEEGGTVRTLELHQLQLPHPGAGHREHGVVAAGAQAAQTRAVGRRVEQVELRGRGGEGEHLD